MTHLGFWAGGYRAHRKFLRQRYKARKARLSEMLSRRERPEHQQRIRELMSQVDSAYLSDTKHADRLIF